MMRLISIFTLWLLGPFGLFSQSDGKLDVLFLNRASLEASREIFQNNPKHLPPALSALMKDADNALKARPLSVMDKNQVPPSGDKHDYMSIASYWWPDTTKPGGLPYIRRDGERNPYRYIVGDRGRIGTMVEQVQALALAYAITGKELFAKGATQRISVWFLDSRTKMNPNLKYAQYIEGSNEGRATGIIDSHGFRDLIDAMVLLRGSPSWTEEVEHGLQQWFTKYLSWLLESENGKEEAAAKNNHGSIYDVQVCCYALFVGNEKIAKRVLREAGMKRIAVQIEPDGSQPLELARTKSWGYSMLNTEALVDLAILGDRLGIDLWHFQTDDDRSLRKAIDFLIPYALGEKTWTWKQIIPFEYERMYPIVKLAAVSLNDSSYAAAVNVLTQKRGGSPRMIFSLPAE